MFNFIHRDDLSGQRRGPGSFPTLFQPQSKATRTNYAPIAHLALIFKL